jgi:uncharacterized membrane protein YraQ (UPF0718 family)
LISFWFSRHAFTGAARRAYSWIPFGVGFVILLSTVATWFEHVTGPLPDWLEAPVVQVQGISVAFLGIFLEALPFLLMGSLASGMLAAFGGSPPMTVWLARRPLLAAAAGSLVGLFVAVGVVGVVPLARRLLEKGAPVPLAIAALLAAPALNPVTAASTLAAFGPGRIFWGRMALTFVTAVFTAWVISRLPNLGFAQDFPARGGGFHAHGSEPTWQARARSGLIRASDTLFEIGSLLAIGALLAAAARALLFAPGWEPTSFTAGGHGTVLHVAAAMGAASLLSSGSAADAFAALSYGAQPGGALLAFLVFGPIVDIKNVLLYVKVFGPRLAVLLLLLPAALTLLAGVLLHGFLAGG